MIYRPSRYEYAGPVIDGPERGDMRAHPYPTRMVAVRQPLSMIANLDDYAPDQIVAHYVEYRWVHSLEAWAMVY